MNGGDSQTGHQDVNNCMSNLIGNTENILSFFPKIKKTPFIPADYISAAHACGFTRPTILYHSQASAWTNTIFWFNWLKLLQISTVSATTWSLRVLAPIKEYHVIQLPSLVLWTTLVKSTSSTTGKVIWLILPRRIPRSHSEKKCMF